MGKRLGTRKRKVARDKETVRPVLEKSGRNPENGRGQSPGKKAAGCRRVMCPQAKAARWKQRPVQGSNDPGQEKKARATDGARNSGAGACLFHCSPQLRPTAAGARAEGGCSGGPNC